VRPEFRGPYIKTVAEVIQRYEGRDLRAMFMVLKITMNFRKLLGDKFNPETWSWEDIAKFKLAEARRWAVPSLLGDSVEHLKWCMARQEQLKGKKEARNDA
jgi:hypothetical protein